MRSNTINRFQSYFYRIMLPKSKEFLNLLSTSGSIWWKNDPFRESAVIAYYSIFSLPGLMVVIIALAGYFFGHEAVTGRLAAEFTSTMGADTALQIQSMTAKAGNLDNSILASIFGIVTIIVGATGVFVQLQESLNRIWEVKADEKKSTIWTILRVRLFSFGLIVSIAFILIVSLVVSSLLSSLNDWLSAKFSDSLLIGVQILNFLVSFLIITLLFDMMYKFLPDAKIKWRHVWVGSILTALLFGIGKFGLGFYFGKANPGEGYGAAGSVILILLWVSYSSMIVLYGAEFTRGYANWRDGTILPVEHAHSKKKR